jgi:hypothetical protein
MLAGLLPVIEWVIYIGVKGASFSATLSGVTLTANLAGGFYVCLVASLFAFVGICSAFGRCCCCNPLMSAHPDEELEGLVEEIKRDTVGGEA